MATCLVERSIADIDGVGTDIKNSRFNCRNNIATRHALITSNASSDSHSDLDT